MAIYVNTFVSNKYKDSNTILRHGGHTSVPKKYLGMGMGMVVGFYPKPILIKPKKLGL